MIEQTRLTASDLATIQAELAAIGDENWEVNQGRRDFCVFDNAGDGILVANCYGNHDRAAFIAAAPSTITVLLREVETQRAALKVAREALARMAEPDSLSLFQFRMLVKETLAAIDAALGGKEEAPGC